MSSKSCEKSAQRSIPNFVHFDDKIVLDVAGGRCYTYYIRKRDRYTKMTNNTALFASMIDRYNDKAYTHEYIWGFVYKHNVYMAHTDNTAMPYVCKLDKASRGAGYALRFCPNTDQKLYLMPKAEVICSEEYFNDMVENSKYNNGEIFEKIVTERYGQTWEKDNVPFTKDGDITVDGVAYQIKFQKATFCNEKSLANLA
jgi:hypothetical protein